MVLFNIKKVNHLPGLVKFICILSFFIFNLLILPTSFVNIAFAEEDKETNEKEAATNEEKQPCPECPDPAKFILKGLEEKKQTIAQEQEQLKKEKKELEQFKEEIDKNLEQLTNLKKQIASDLKRLEGKNSVTEKERTIKFEEKMSKLVKVYSKMKPKKAAKIIDSMDLKVAVEIFSRMGKRFASKILNYVDSEKSAKITERLVNKYPPSKRNLGKQLIEN